RDPVPLDVVCNVVGTAPRTVFGVEAQEGGVVLKLTTEGDGRITHQSAEVKNLATWYADAVHGELVSDAPTLDAIQELLDTGASKHLPGTPPSASRGGARVW